MIEETANKILRQTVAKKEQSLKPYTKEEIDAMLDEAEQDFEAGNYLTQEEVFRHN